MCNDDGSPQSEQQSPQQKAAKAAGRPLHQVFRVRGARWRRTSSFHTQPQAGRFLFIHLQMRTALAPRRAGDSKPQATYVVMRLADCRQMSHPKARVEYPEDLRARVEDVWRKLRTARDTNAVAAVDASTQSAQVDPQCVLSASFPDFECDLTILRKRSIK